MKKILSPRGLFCKLMLLFVCLQIAVSSANARKAPVTETRYEIEGVETGVQGTYLVKVYVWSKKQVATIDEFKYAAVHGVIFRGFNGKGFSSQKPLARPETQAQNADFYDAFFSNGDYMAYAEVINPTADRVKIGKEYKIAAIVSVSKESLRKTLEGAGVIRSLNSGF